MIYVQDIHGFEIEVFKTADFAVLPLGSIEYHGPSSPFGTDNLLAESFSALIDPELNGIIYPCIPYSLCPGKTTRYTGTISISAEVSFQYMKEVCKGISKSGIKNIILLNAHDANMSLSRTVAESLTNDDLEVDFLLVNWWQMVDIEEAENIGFTQTKGRGHGGPYEMSAVKYLKPEWIPRITGEEFPEPDKYSKQAYVEIEAFPKQWDGYTGLINQISVEAGEKIVSIASANMNSLIKKWIEERKGR